MASRTLIVCDLQPDVVRKLPRSGRRRFVDLVGVAVDAARMSSVGGGGGVRVVHTMLKFEGGTGYDRVDPQHPRLGVLRRLGASNPGMTWFTSDERSVGGGAGEDETETVVPRTTYLPHASDEGLMEVLRRCVSSLPSTVGATSTFTVIGYGPTVQAVCHILGDVLAVPGVQVIGDCVADDREGRREAMLEHGLLFDERVVSLVDFLEDNDVLNTAVGRADAAPHTHTDADPPPKYVSDTGRGGHLCLFMPYLLRDHGYTEWPVQPWYEETTSLATPNKKYFCPLGQRRVHLCDEPRFTRLLRLFLKGRRHLDDKDLLHDLVPDLMPPTFDSLQDARKYAIDSQKEQNNGDGGPDRAEKLLWFIKAVNMNGGRAVRVTNDLSSEKPLAANEQLQVHVPRPLLYGEAGLKFHIKTYQHISCAGDGRWHVYIYDLFYLSTAGRPWNADDTTDETQITTMRTKRMYPDDVFRTKWNLTELVRSNATTLMERAVRRGKLRSVCQPADEGEGATTTEQQQQPQFEVNSADWMLDRDGRLYLIECNGIPVLYDPTSPKKQELVTRGLRLYDRLYREDPENAVVNDTDLIREALDLGLTGNLPPNSLWKHMATISAPDAAAIAHSAEYN